MRSVRALDVLFTAHAAVNLLSRVAAAQASKICHTQQQPPPSSVDAQQATKRNEQRVDEIKASITEVEEPNPIETATKPTSFESTLSGSPLPISPAHTQLGSTPQIEAISQAPYAKTLASRKEVRERYAKTPSKLYRNVESLTIDTAPSPVVMKASRVPSSRMGRLFHYGSLAAGMGIGAASEFMRRAVSPSDASGSVLMSEANVTRLVEKLSRMRGAALKLGQFMSIQDSHMLPPQVEQIFRRVQNNAHYMPNWQMEKVMATELGADWRSHFSEFNPVPIAAASIGQVHAATLASNGMPLAIKIQFPAVAESITSDLNNLSMLLTASSLLPKGLFLENTLKATKAELEDECDYRREAECARRFRQELQGDERFEVMQILDDLSTGKVLVMERMTGVPIVRAENWPQELRNEIASGILSLCLRELFHFRFMQTDPNWTNFLYNTNNGKIQLIDFGASREYSKEFMDDWLRLLQAGVDGNKELCARYSLRLGYLTGQESQEMVDAHVKSIMLLAAPFRRSTPQPYDFADQTISEEIRALIPFMLQNRLTPPPRETYSLNRKLSGAFLLCGRLKAEVDCADVWEDATAGYQFTTAD
ncbi:Protein ABC1 homolog, mitochondrial Flags: Precursor [Serendipita indica DSM 11827]|uniref:Related to ABC1-ubiquinol--cytochrome-c reductase complex assembly protein n=1 Tax=Serendipita indica (strain DSM 11827) TaxID=1109443 RepID=G4TWR4_SERID|nr:Protein ABC1 homolog, mitochondrial Flags: Precursor [Serendipita indica DSM 11827]CCA75757.1 related to ABC1-ubiquinol--cytochrome-c reductase complex assembly protein [Serendipita indica DSM 11827]